MLIPSPPLLLMVSEALGDQAWRESGLGAPADIDALNRKITHLEQRIAGLRLQLDERGGELAAARAANRELMTQLNAVHHRRPGTCDRPVKGEGPLHWAPGIQDR